MRIFELLSSVWGEVLMIIYNTPRTDWPRLETKLSITQCTRFSANKTNLYFYVWWLCSPCSLLAFISMFLHQVCLLSDIFNKLLLLSSECPAGCGSYALIEMVNSFSVSPELQQGQSTPHTFCSMLERVRVERREILLLKIVQIISTTTCQQYYLILPLSLPPSLHLLLYIWTKCLAAQIIHWYF